MKRFLSGLLILVALSANAQVTFQIAYGDSALDCGYHVLECFDQGYLITGTAGIPNTSDASTLLIRTNKFGDTLWTKMYSGQYINNGRSAKQLSDSGFVIASASSNGYIGMGLIRTDKFGDTLFTKSWFGGSNNVQILSDGGFLLSGNYNGNNPQLIRLDANFDTVWTRGYGGPIFNICTAAKQTSDGGFILCGSSNSWGAGNYDYLVIKTDSLGIIQWSKVYGGIAEDRANDIVEISSGGYMVIGNSYSYSFNQFSTDMLVMRLDSAGTITGAATFGGYTYDYGQAMEELPDGKFLLAGYTQSFGNGSTDGFLVKLGPGGNMLWSKTYGMNQSEGFWSMCSTSDGGVVMTGVTGYGVSQSGDAFLVKVDSMGLNNCFETIPACTMNVVVPATANAPLATFHDCQTGAQYYTARSGLIVSPICTITETEEITGERNSSAYPNPFSHETTLQFSNPDNEKLICTIFDVWGRVVLQENNVRGNSFVINGEDLSLGIYLYRIESVGRVYSSGRLIKE